MLTGISAASVLECVSTLLKYSNTQLMIACSNCDCTDAMYILGNVPIPYQRTGRYIK
jgi:hypothetical protein